MLYQSSPTSLSFDFFHSQQVPGGVQLTWGTTPDVTTLGFNLYRRERSGAFVKLNTDYISALAIRQPQAGTYAYLDTSVAPGTVYEYRLDVIENSLQVSASTTLTYWPYTFALPLIVR
jgi:hypothetical protein